MRIQQICIESGLSMKSGKTLFGVLLIAFYLFFPGNGLALANHFFQDRGLPLIECPCCAETAKNTTDYSFPESGDESDIFEHACNCSCHLPSATQTLVSFKDFACLLPGEAQQLYQEVYFPIFVPPQNLS